ncbi:MAG TPA: hypothetical protein VGJ75_16255 [Dongiaceae bacterium]|jgi:hypothetical protein
MECSTELIENVYRAWPRFDADGAVRQSGHVPDLGVLRISIANPLGAQGDYVAVAARTFQALLYRGAIYAEGFELALFLTENTWQPNNRIIRYKKTWGIIAQFNRLGNLRPGAEVLIEDPRGIRFASMAAVNPSSIATAFDLISSSGYHGLVLLTRTPDYLGEDFAREIYGLSFPHVSDSKRGGQFELGNVCFSRCAKGDLVANCGLESDGSCFLVDVFGAAAALKQLANLGVSAEGR